MDIDSAAQIDVASGSSAVATPSAAAVAATQSADGDALETSAAQASDLPRSASGHETLLEGSTVAVDAASTAPSSAPASSKRKKARSRKWSVTHPPSRSSKSAAASAAPAAAAAAAATVLMPNGQLPFSKRFISKWVDSDEESADEAEAARAAAALQEPAHRAKKAKLASGSGSGSSGSKALVVAAGAAAAAADALSDGPDKSFWQWTNAFTVCQPCGFRLENRKYCPICVQIYDRRTTDPMVQCDSCQRWVHIACDPNAQANESKLIKDNTLYHCSECLRRERSNEMTLLLDDLVSQDRNKSFLHPVSEALAPDYYLTIRTPMDFSTIYQKLMELQYQSIDQFKFDLNLIWRNAKDYNAVGSSVHRSALRLQSKSQELFKALAAKHGGAGGLFDSIGRIDDEEEENRKREAERAAREAEAKRKRQLRKLQEAQYPRPPRLEHLAAFLSFDDARLCEVDTCLLCGSVGDEADLLFCADCGECAHSWCFATSLANDGNPLAADDAELVYAKFHRLSDEQRAQFRCPNCEVCNVCGQQDKMVRPAHGGDRAPDRLVACEHCHGISHVSCVPYLHGQTPQPHAPYKCPRCVVCRCCQSTVAGKHSGDEWSVDYSLCSSCNKLYLAGSVCQVCDLPYKSRDENTPMMCCDGCARWIHMECDGLKLEQYLTLTRDSGQKYFCPQCRQGATPIALHDKANRDAARRLNTDRKKLERNKLNMHIGCLPLSLPAVRDELQLHAQYTQLLERSQAKRRRLAAQQRHQTVVALNEALLILRERDMPIPPIDEPSRVAAQQRHVIDLEAAIDTVAHSGSHFPHQLCVDLALFQSPAAKRLQQQEQQLRDVQAAMERADEQMHAGEIASAAGVADPAAADSHATDSSAAAAAPSDAQSAVKIESGAQGDQPLALEPTNEAAAATSAKDEEAMDIQLDTQHAATGAELHALLHSGSGPVTAGAAAAAAPLSSVDPPSSLSFGSVCTDGDWRICALCRKVGDQEVEGRLLAALCPTARWLHVQCALWSDGVTTSVKGQLTCVMQRLRQYGECVCTVCGLPGASLKCKRFRSCPRYHFACAQSRGCLFTLDKDFYCEAHSATSKRLAERRVALDKICRRITIRNDGWNRRDIFSMRITHGGDDAAQQQQQQHQQSDAEKARDAMSGDAARDADTADSARPLSRESLRRQESLLSDYYSDYEDQGDGVWKRAHLSFLSRAGERAEAEAAQLARQRRKERSELASAALAAVLPPSTFQRREQRLRNLNSRLSRDPDEHEHDHDARGHDESSESSDEEGGAQSASKDRHPKGEAEGEDGAPMEVDAQTADQEASNKDERDGAIKVEAGAEAGAEGDEADADADADTGAAVPTSSRSSSSRRSAPKSSRRQRERERDERIAAAAQRARELEKLLHGMPAVCPSTTAVFLKIGALSVTDLGELVPESRAFHSPEYLFPLGYRAVRLYWSYRRPGARASFLCEVLAAESRTDDADAAAAAPATSSDTIAGSNKLVASSASARPSSSLVTLSLSSASAHPRPQRLVPLFRITASDDIGHPIVATSAPAAWQQLMRLFPDFESRNSVRPRMRSGDTWTWGLGGAAFFGFSIGQVQAQLEQLPRADQCRRYRFKHVDSMVEKQKQRQIEREKQGREELSDSEPEIKGTAIQSATTGNSAAPVAAASAAAATAAAIAPSASPDVCSPDSSLFVPLNPSGSARTEGYAKQLGKFGVVEVDTTGAPSLTPPSEHWSAISILPDDATGRRRKVQLTSTNSNRPLKEIPLATQYRVMKASPPRARVAHSVIHEWGLFSNQDLEEGAMVIEYLGELIRPRMADIREKYYEDNGLDSCYMFRIDSDYIVDSTKRGNISRFINHSCDPNCKTDIIESSSGKKIVVLAQRPIAKDEEITYDYFFASEEEKIRCNCGAVNCAGRLN